MKRIYLTEKKPSLVDRTKHFFGGQPDSLLRRPPTRVQISVWGLFILMLLIALLGFIANVLDLAGRTSRLSTRLAAMPVEAPEIEIVPELADLETREKAVAIIKRVWRKDAEVGIALATCESGLRPTAVNDKNTNRTKDVGLFQINSVHSLDHGDLENPVANAAFAYTLYREQGTNPWNSSKKCWAGKL